jgi:thioredoxin-dependent peroxiredoxin
MRKLVIAAAVCFGATALVVGQSPQAPAPPELKIKVGDVAPAFSLPGTDGKTHRLSDYKGKMVVLAWFPRAGTQG